MYVVYATLMAGMYFGSRNIQQPLEPLGPALYAVASGSCVVAAACAEEKQRFWWWISGTTITVATVWRLSSLIALVFWETGTPPDNLLIAICAYATIFVSLPFVWLYMKEASECPCKR
jgi:hypothetical protein